MDTKLTAGFCEQPHTADWALEVWAPDAPGLFDQAGQGMLELMGVKVDRSIRIQRSLHLASSDLESLLVSFLTELLYLLEVEGLAFNQYKLTIESNRLNANLIGRPVLKMDKEIKAVTYHNLAIEHDINGLRTTLIFDV